MGYDYMTYRMDKIFLGGGFHPGQIGTLPGASVLHVPSRGLPVGQVTISEASMKCFPIV